MKNSVISGKSLFILHFALLISSLSGVCSKQAALSGTVQSMIFWYSGVLLLMGIYAVIWQQILVRMPLTVAYSNKPIGLIWGMVWGKCLFHEAITPGMLLSAAVIFAGIWLVVTSDA